MVVHNEKQGEKSQQGLLGSKPRKFKRLRGGRASKLRISRGQRAGYNKNNEPYIASRAKKAVKSRSVAKLERVRGLRSVADSVLYQITYFITEHKQVRPYEKTAGEFESRLGYYIFNFLFINF